MKIRTLQPADLQAASDIMKEAQAAGDILYKPLSAQEMQKAFFGEKRYALAAVDSNDSLYGFVALSAKTTFLNDESEENTPMFLTLILVRKEKRNSGIGTALLNAAKELALKNGKKVLNISSNNPVNLTWLIPGANGHDHNNAPGVNEEGMGYAWLLSKGFHADFHEISLYEDLSNYHWDSELDQKLAALAAEGIQIGRWHEDLGAEFDGMCDRVGSEYWRNVLRTEIAAWRENRPNDQEDLWPDGRKPAGPRPILTATKDGHIIGFTGPVDLQESGRGWFTGICTDPLWGGRSIGSLLFNCLMQEFVKEGAAFCSLFTGANNHAQKIYLRAGLHVTSHWSVMSCSLDDSSIYDHTYF